MIHLLSKSKALIRATNNNFKRSLALKIDWQGRLIGILGARGTGKTTLLLQQLKSSHGYSDEAIYLTLDDIYFAKHSLTDTIEKFIQEGGKYLYLDDVHKYPTWARELKNCYDFFSDIKIVFTGSSIIDLLKEDVDLSRRAIQYELAGLSFREYLEYTENEKYQTYTLDYILKHHVEIASTITEKIKPLKHFHEYLKYGYYPFFKEGILSYQMRIEQVIRLIVESELSFINGFSIYKSRKILQFLGILGENVSFQPNISKLSEKLEIHRNTLMEYIHYLEKGRLINTLYAGGISTSKLQKPDKIFLENTNLSFVLANNNIDKGNLRETFALNQLRSMHEISMPKKGDFLVDNKIVFEIGGKQKNNKQITDIENAYILSDDIEIGSLNKIPLWLLGFMY